MSRVVLHLNRILDECDYLLALPNLRIDSEFWNVGKKHWGTRNYAAAMSLIRIGNAVKELAKLDFSPDDLTYDEYIPTELHRNWKHFARFRDKLAHDEEIKFQKVWEAVVMYVAPFVVR